MNRLMPSLLLFFLCFDIAGIAAPASPTHILVCGSAQVLEGTIEQKDGKPAFKTLWAWRPENSAGLPRTLMSSFAGTDECKPVDRGKDILITSSSDALALVEHKTGKTLFYAKVRNAHSAALMPGGLIVAASSFSADGSGDRLLLFDKKTSDRVLAQLPFAGAHGVEWDPVRKVLWALSDRDLAEIKIEKDKKGAIGITVQQVYPLPERGGHDLVLSRDNSVLYLTTSREVFIFHPDGGTFSPFPIFGGRSNVKSLSINPVSGQIMYTQSGPGVWWTYKLKFLSPESEVPLAEHAYKARWFTVDAHDDK